MPVNKNTDEEQDRDGDLVLRRRIKSFLKLEHSKKSALDMVGHQIWRGAFLLNDYIIHFRENFRGKNIMELGSGVGLTSIVAAFYGKEILCTDLDIGGLLGLIRRNVELNKNMPLEGNISVCELDFLAENWSDLLTKQVSKMDIIVAADVIYDDRITEAFIRTIDRIFQFNRAARLLMALEKRYVFTIKDLDSVAPCFEHFLQRFNDKFGCSLQLIFVPIDFPQYFEYERVKELVLMEIIK